jgi:hypothetical protein
MLRVPGSINSKNNVQVKIVKRFDQKTQSIPNINLLIGSFCAYLADQQIKQARYNYRAVGQQQSTSSFYNNNNSNSNNNHQENIIYWIEKLLQTPLPDYRRNCIWRILAPYLINERRLSYDQSFNILASWLDNCSKLRRLHFNSKSKIKTRLE